MKKLALSSMFGATLVFAAATAGAQQFDRAFKDWSSYTINQGGKKVCYIASSPKKQAGNYNHRSDPYLLVTHVSSGVDEVSTSSGYPYKNGSEVTVAIDKETYKMFTKGELAWAYNKDNQDARMVEAMKKGSNLTVKGTSTKGTNSTDTYSLSGFTAAYNRMKGRCK